MSNRPEAFSLRHTLLTTALLAALATGTPALAAHRSHMAQPSQTAAAVDIAYRVMEVDGVKVFYREAGPAHAPTLLLLHGFPSSSHMYRNLIPQLATRYHVIAPDLPGFGFTEAPKDYVYSFDHLAGTLGAFTEALKLDRYAVYVFDYGSPVGFRLALAHPERITALITQNGNAYQEGLSTVWNPISRYWNAPTPANRAALKDFLKPDSVKFQYTQGAGDITRLSPDGYTYDAALLARPGQEDIQLDLFLDYRSNVALYPAFQAWLRRDKPPVLAVWGRNDPFFLPAGAEAFRRDVPKAKVVFYDAGHFALETRGREIGAEVLSFLDRNVKR